MGEAEKGIVVYLRQEGRGIGLLNKLRAYALQDHGFDTVQANIELGFRDDERDYAVAAALLQKLNVISVRLMTNNPNKIKQLEKHGMIVSERVPLIIPPNPFNIQYLKTKEAKSKHMLSE